MAYMECLGIHFSVHVMRCAHEATPSCSWTFATAQNIGSPAPPLVAEPRTVGAALRGEFLEPLRRNQLHLHDDAFLHASLSAADLGVGGRRAGGL